MNPALIYTYWQDNELDPAQNMYAPIIPSITSFRHFHPDIPVYVIDMSDRKTNWGDWPKRLNFHISVKNRFFNDRNPFKPMTAKLLSRPEAMYWKMRNIKEDVVVSVDSDIIFVQELFPLNHRFDKFNIAPNIGLFYLDMNKPKSHHLMELWQSLCLMVCHSADLKNKIIRQTYLSKIHEEGVMKYIRHEMKLYEFRKIVHENCLLHHPWKYDWIEIEKVKAIHLNYYAVKQDIIDRRQRAKWFMYFEESNKAMRDFFTKEEIRLIFDKLKLEPKSFKDLEHWGKMINHDKLR